MAIIYLNIQEEFKKLRRNRCDSKSDKLLSKHQVTKPIFENNENFINCQDTEFYVNFLITVKNFLKARIYFRTEILQESHMNI